MTGPPSDRYALGEEPRTVECAHTSVSHEAGYPDRSGRCRVYEVCEDCGAVGRQTGWDSVL